jgi:hypothetical protein
MLRSMSLSMFDWVWRVVQMVRGERGIGEGELSQGGSWMKSSCGNSTEAL